MARIVFAKLKMTHDHERQLVEVEVKCTVRFTDFELCQMTQCPKGKLFRLRCEIWGSDKPPEIGPDDWCYTFKPPLYFQGPGINRLESRTFKETFGEGVLDEDEDEWYNGEIDEINGKLILVNLYTLNKTKRKTKIVRHRFD